MAAVTIGNDFGDQQKKICHCFHFSPFYLPWSDGTGCHDLSFWMLNFKTAFSISSSTILNRLFSSSSLSAIGVVFPAYLRLLIFLPAIFISAWHFTWYTLHTRYVSRVTIDRLVCSFSNLETVDCSMFGSNCCFLTHLQVSQETGKMVWYYHLCTNFSLFVVIHRVKCFSIVNEAEVDVFLEFPCFLHDPTNVGNMISGSFAFSKTKLLHLEVLGSDTAEA